MVARTFAAAQRDHILEVLRETDGHRGAYGAAAHLGLPRTTLICKMRKLGIETRRSHRRPRIEPTFADRGASVALADAL